VSGSETKTYHAACLQFNVERGETERNLATVTEGLRAATEEGAELVVLPEMWTTSFLKEPTDDDIRRSNAAEHALLELSKELKMMVIGSAPEVSDGRYFNRARIFDCGEVLGTYRKIHMFSPNAEDRYMTPGSQPLVVDTRLGRIGVVMCYDIRFPELTRYYFHCGVQVLAVPAQWPEARADHWRTLIRARAIENQSYVIGCNRIGTEGALRNDDNFVFPGDSRIIDPMGDVIAAANGDDQPIIAEISLRRCQSMHRILPVHEDRQPDAYRNIWLPIWSNPDEPKTPTIPTIDKATPTTKT
jgi:predicted amidohydrolase